MAAIGDDEENSLVESFISVTSASRDEALFFLESHNFQLESAIHSFYENNGDQDHDRQGLGQELEEEIAAVPPPPIVPPHSDSPAPAAMSSRDDKKKKAAKPSSSRGGIRTLADLNQSGGTGSDSDSDGPQEYYTGGEKR